MPKSDTKIWLYTSLATVLATVFCYVFYIILDVNVLDYLSKQNNEADVVNYYYKIQNRKSNDGAYTAFYDPEIVILDLEGTKSRVDIADAIKRVSDLLPRAIILDVIFPENSTTLQADDDYLKKTIASASNLYTAVRIDGNKLEKSFFQDETGVQYGLANKVSHYKPYEIFGKDTLYYLPFAVIKEQKKENRNLLINYSDKAFDIYPIAETLTPEDIGNRIVLIGDLQDLRDKYDMPFSIGGERRVSGTTLLAYNLSTALHHSWIVQAPRWIGFLLALCVCFGFTYFCYRLRSKGEDGNNPWYNFIETAARIVLIILFLLLGYLFFVWFGLMVNMVYVILTTALTGLSMNIIEVCTYKRKKK
ncbi:CHASE2 domain-containing protein [Paludibacter sp. 221]|uniref:CHASE2 domain-containing protein n=1 Tax=Paludibacter sp. 221 TaxID=2302939 RepID=UPI0013D3970D|nr:CHASE2 domain-containing protein [Paludibacter sp. 221]NDV47512.1 CHASE2 domain-containing protein [Paludibacter sp. 221]